AVSITGWVLVVRSSSSFGPSEISLARSNCRASDASASVCCTTGLSAKPLSMPMACEPCPGKTNANVVMLSLLLLYMSARAGLMLHADELHADQYRAPGEAAAHAFHHDVLARLDAAVAHADVERQRNRRCRGVAVLVNRDDHLVHAQAQLLRRALHDADVGL